MSHVTEERKEKAGAPLLCREKNMTEFEAW